MVRDGPRASLVRRDAVALASIPITYHLHCFHPDVAV